MEKRLSTEQQLKLANQFKKDKQDTKNQQKPETKEEELSSFEKWILRYSFGIWCSCIAAAPILFIYFWYFLFLIRQVKHAPSFNPSPIRDVTKAPEGVHKFYAFMLTIGITFYVILIIIFTLGPITVIAVSSILTAQEVLLWIPKIFQSAFASLISFVENLLK